MRNILFLAGLLLCHPVIAQNVGIGTATPGAPLHLKSTSAEVLRIESNSPYISFFNGSGSYSGYLWYNTTATAMELGTPFLSGQEVVIAPNVIPLAYFTPNGRVGLGTSSPTERLDVNGNINLNGVIKLNGSSGVAGQVLTSNGTADPVWKNTAFANNTRFSARTNTATETNAFTYTTNYNTNTTDITISASSITINKTGLYHFDVYLYTNIKFGNTAPLSTFVDHSVTIDGNNYNLEEVNPGRLVRGGTGNIYEYHLSSKSSLEIYVTAPATVQLGRSFAFSIGGTGSVYQSRAASGWISGYLISE